MKTSNLILVLPFLLIFGCNPGKEDDDIYQTIELTEKAARLVEADNGFGFALFQDVYASETQNENIMVSPLSVALALAMTYNGAEAETKAAMEETLKVYGLTADEINTSYQTLVKALKSLDSKVVLEIADAIFYRQDFMVENDFVAVNREYYDAEVTPLDFGSPGAVKTINNWVAQKTHNKIETILDRISGDHVMFLLNAIYFKGTWQSEFEKENTKKDAFSLENGSTVQTDFMQQTNAVPYVSNELFSAVQLAYGKGNYNMYVFLPQTGKTLYDVVTNLGSDSWQTWMGQFSEANVDIRLPKFKFGYEVKLNDVLSGMGMGVAFSDFADFSGINKGGGLKIDYVKHKSFIEVNEEGTEAAAVTVVAVELTSAGPGSSYIPFHVNRPFLFAITEKSTGAVLFMGTVKKPQLN